MMLVTTLWLIAMLTALVGLGLAGSRLGVQTTTNRIQLAQGRWAAEACLAIAGARWTQRRLADTATIDLGQGKTCAWRVDDPTARVNVNVGDPAVLKQLSAISRQPSTDSLLLVVLERRRARPFENVEELRGTLESSVLAVLTVDGPGTVNVNAAARVVLAALPGMTPEAVDLVLYRRSVGRPFESLDAVAGALSPPRRAALLASYAELARTVTFGAPQLLLTADGWVGRREGGRGRGEGDAWCTDRASRRAVTRATGGDSEEDAVVTMPSPRSWIHALKGVPSAALRLSAATHRALTSASGLQRRRLGISVSARAVHALLLEGGRITWAGAADYDTTADLAEVIARLAGECGHPARRARVVLTRDVVQLRTLLPAPPLKARAVARYVALEAPRLFRKNGKPLVTDGHLVVVTSGRSALWAAAAEEPLLRAALSGCAQAGLDVDDVGPVSDVLLCAVTGTDGSGSLVLPNGGSSEVIEVGKGGAWRSRLVREDVGGETWDRWVPDLDSFGLDASRYASAYAAAIARPRLSLLPPDTRAARLRRARRSLVRLSAIAAGLWFFAGTTYVARLAVAARSAEAELSRLGSAVDSALAVRRELGLAEVTLATLADAERRRSRHLELLAMLTNALGDSIHLVALRVAPDGTVRLAGYAPLAARALSALERVAGLREPRFEGPVTREARSRQRETWDRFSVVARLDVTP